MSHIDSGGDPNSVKAGRELADVSIPALWHHALYLVITCVVVWLAMMGLFKFTIGRLSDRDPAVSALARPAGEPPPEPRLLTNEPLNLQQFRERESRVLENYGFIDQAAGTVHLPIERAKELLLERGLPSRGSSSRSSSQFPAEPSTGTGTGTGNGRGH